MSDIVRMLPDFIGHMQAVGAIQVDASMGLPEVVRRIIGQS